MPGRTDPPPEATPLPRVLLIALVLATAAVSVLPSAEADTCASQIAEEIVCPPILLTYCAMYALVEKYPLTNCVD